MFLKVEGSWLYSTRLLKLERRGVEQPLLFILRAWQYCLNECREDAPTLTEEALSMMEEQLKWAGDEGALIEAFRACGVLDGNTLDLWWEDGAEPLNAIRRVEREKKRRQRKKAVPPKPTAVPNQREPVPAKSEPVPPKPVGTRSQSRVEESRVEKNNASNATDVQKDGEETKPDSASWLLVRNQFCSQWEKREVEASRTHPREDRGFFGDRGVFAMQRRLDSLYKRGPEEAIEGGIAGFWDWWDTTGKRIKKKGWRPTPANVADVLETRLVGCGMLTKQQWLASLMSADEQRSASNP